MPAIRFFWDPPSSPCPVLPGFDWLASPPRTPPPPLRPVLTALTSPLLQDSMQHKETVPLQTGRHRPASAIKYRQQGFCCLQSLADGLVACYGLKAISRVGGPAAIPGSAAASRPACLPACCKPWIAHLSAQLSSLPAAHPSQARRVPSLYPDLSSTLGEHFWPGCCSTSWWIGGGKVLYKHGTAVVQQKQVIKWGGSKAGARGGGWKSGSAAARRSTMAGIVCTACLAGWWRAACWAQEQQRRRSWPSWPLPAQQGLQAPAESVWKTQQSLSASASRVSQSVCLQVSTAGAASRCTRAGRRTPHHTRTRRGLPLGPPAARSPPLHSRRPCSRRGPPLGPPAGLGRHSAAGRRTADHRTACSARKGGAGAEQGEHADGWSGGMEQKWQHGQPCPRIPC